MAGAGIEVHRKLLRVSADSQFSKILEALEKASVPDLEAIADFMGGELHDISNTAFQKRADPVTGEGWADLKYPYKGDKKSTLRRSGILFASRNWITEGGAVIYGSNMEYARIHWKQSFRRKAARQKPIKYNYFSYKTFKPMAFPMFPPALQKKYPQGSV
jgi:phage gpG-like protein